MMFNIQSRRHGIVEIHFDEADWELIKQFKWSLKQTQKSLYVHTVNRNTGFHMDMHRLIMGSPENKEIDHRDGNGLNNRRNNLRIATHSQNCANRDKMPYNTTGYKGVYRTRGKYKAQIKVNRKCISGGKLFDNPIDAARRYNQMAIQYFGEFARLNVIPLFK